MDIHQPKPWHGLREFLKEYLIIVVGVLTALGAESLVENLHERRLSAEAREAVRAEINVNITNMARRVPLEPCLSRRFDEIEALLDRAEPGRHYEPPSQVMVLDDAAVMPAVYEQRWQAATAGGRTSLLSSEEQRAFGRVYEAFRLQKESYRQELETWRRLSVLEHLRQLSPGMNDAQRIALSDARILDRQFNVLFEQAKIFAAQVGVKGDAQLFVPTEILNRPPSSYPICQPLQTLKTGKG